MAKQDGPGPEKLREKKRAEDAKRQSEQNRQIKTIARKKAKSRGETTPTGTTNFYRPTQRKKPEFDEKNDSCTNIEISKVRGKGAQKEQADYRRKAGERKTNPAQHANRTTQFVQTYERAEIDNWKTKRARPGIYNTNTKHHTYTAYNYKHTIHKHKKLT